MTEKLLIIHADDAGMGNNINQAIFKGLEQGFATCASILMPCPWLMQVVKYAKEYLEADLGLHLAPTSEWALYRWGPVSSPDKVPGLIDREGYLWNSVEGVVKNATPEEVETEIRAQVQRALDLGLEPTHLDTHMGVLYATPQLFEAWMRVAGEFDIPPMLVSPESQVAKYRRQSQPEVVNPILERMGELSTKFPVLDELVMDVGPVELEPRRQAWEKVIRSLKPGITQVIVHFAYDCPEMRAMDSLWARKRVNDFLIFSHPSMREIIEEEEIRLIGWREFVEEFRP